MLEDARPGERWSLSVETTEVVVIGAGPSGLAVGACLQKRRVDFIIVEKEHQVGSSWRRHYERLHLHTIKSRPSLPFRSFDRSALRSESPCSSLPGGICGLFRS